MLLGNENFGLFGSTYVDFVAKTALVGVKGSELQVVAAGDFPGSAPRCLHGGESLFGAALVPSESALGSQAYLLGVVKIATTRV